MNASVKTYFILAAQVCATLTMTSSLLSVWSKHHQPQRQYTTYRPPCGKMWSHNNVDNILGSVSCIRLKPVYLGPSSIWNLAHLFYSSTTFRARWTELNQNRPRIFES